MIKPASLIKIYLGAFWDILSQQPDTSLIDICKVGRFKKNII